MMRTRFADDMAMDVLSGSGLSQQISLSSWVGVCRIGFDIVLVETIKHSNSELGKGNGGVKVIVTVSQGLNGGE
jgi:hypothetical protein